MRKALAGDIATVLGNQMSFINNSELASFIKV